MIVITRTPVMNLIPDDLLSELVGVTLNVVETKKDRFLVKKEEVLEGLKKLNRNYALQYFEKAIHFFGVNGLISISRDVAGYVV